MASRRGSVTGLSVNGTWKISKIVVVVALYLCCTNNVYLVVALNLCCTNNVYLVVYKGSATRVASATR